jgi:hypothetical protein
MECPVNSLQDNHAETFSPNALFYRAYASHAYGPTERLRDHIGKPIDHRIQCPSK